MPSVSVESCLQRGRILGKRLESELILAHVLGSSRASVFAHPEWTLTQAQSLVFDALWFQIEAEKPLAYVLNRQEFWGLYFFVDERVLIPRPETELLVECVLNRVAAMGECLSPRIVEVGTGSGAIAVALQHVLPEAEVFAVDVSSDALEVAQMNALSYGCSGIQFVESDLLQECFLDEVKPDFVVANLPYIGTEQFDFVQDSVRRYEPALALFAGADGLDLYRRLFDQIFYSKWKPQFLLGEFGDAQRLVLESILLQRFPGYCLEFYKDGAGFDRVFVLNFDRSSFF